MRQALVPGALAGGRFDSIAAQLFDDFSRGQLQRWIKSAELRADGAQRTAGARLAAGVRLSLAARLPVESGCQAEPLTLCIVHEDRDLLVVDKPAGLVVHPGAGNPGGTLLNGLLHQYPALESVPRAGIVHRLDKDTTGLLLVARNLSAHANLVAQLQARRVRRQYLALVRGLVTAGGTVRAAIGRHRVQRLKMAAYPDGAGHAKEAISHYRVLARYRAHSLLSLLLETGRTHQIRVHMAHLGYPLVGDPLYGGRARPPAGLAPALALQLGRTNRQALHATRLDLLHPGDGRPCSWRSAPPADMQDLVDALERDAAGD